MRRLLIIALFVLVLLPANAFAAGWHHAGGRAYGFRLSYPSHWSVSSLVEPGNTRQLTLSYQGKQVYGLTILVLNLSPGRSLGQTAARFSQYERAQGNSSLIHVHWSAASLGRRRAMVGVVRPQTEGGVGQAQGIYLAPWRGKVYQVTMSAFSRHAPRTVGAFPSVYRRILATWRFL